MQLTFTKSSIQELPDVTAGKSALEPRHRWYYFKEGFSPAIVDKAIDESGLRSGDRIYDPFSGSGTTVLSGASRGLIANGTEVNPFLHFVSSTKGSASKASELDRIVSSVIAGIKKGAPSALEKFSTFSEKSPAGIKREKWLFPSTILRGFEGGYRAISNASDEVKNPVLLALISAAMDCANAYKDGKCLRYHSDWSDNESTRSDFLNSFSAKISDIKDDLDESSPSGVINVRNTDCRKARVNAFDLCITSPPYLNSFDYTDVYRPELFLGKFVQSMDELTALRLRTIRSHVQIKWPKPKFENFGYVYASTFAKLLEIEDAVWIKSLTMMVQSYFEDMRRVLINLKKSAKPEASLWIVVSNSAYGGVDVPVDLILAEIGSRVGWRLKEVSILRYLGRSSFQQQRDFKDRGTDLRLRESLIILENK